MKEHVYYTYILNRERNSVLYVGVTNNLIPRVYEHKEDLVPGFTKKYDIKILIYYECHDDIRRAIHREKIIKKWKRKFKVDAMKYEF